MSSDTLDLFPRQIPSYILSFQFSSWYPTFADISIKSTVVRPLSGEFKQYLQSENVFVPEGSENAPAESTLPDPEDDNDEDEDEGPKYAFPELDAKIRECVKQYDAVFPKLNFTSPRDASWILPASSPLKCVSPADVYMLLKSSDFVSHDLTPESVFENCDLDAEEKEQSTYELELVLRKWYPVNPSREVRCFVRNGRFIAISQRDTNRYDFIVELETREKIVKSISEFWAEKIKPRMNGQNDYIFDFLLTRDLTRGHIIDLNPYSPRTDSLLFSFEELRELAESASSKAIGYPEEVSPQFRYIDSASHPAAQRNAPTHQHNMVPFEALQMSSGQDIESFAAIWQSEVASASKEEGALQNRMC